MNVDAESPATALYRAACAGSVEAQVQLSQNLMDLAPFELGALAVAEAWALETMKQNEIVGGYGVGQVRLRLARIASDANDLDKATHHYAVMLALLDGIADEGGDCADALALIDTTLDSLPDGICKADVIDLAKQIRRDAESQSGANAGGH